MHYDDAQRQIETFVKTNWDSDGVAVQFENVAFNSELYTEYVRCTVVFGEGDQRCVTAGSYRQFGLLLMSVFVKPGIGVHRMNQLSDTVSDRFASLVLQPDPPATVPKVKFKVPSAMRDTNEKLGWVMAQVSIPFYYDI